MRVREAHGLEWNGRVAVWTNEGGLSNKCRGRDIYCSPSEAESCQSRLRAAGCGLRAATTGPVGFGRL